MDAFVCACAADEGRFLGVCGVGFGDCACCDEGGEEFSFDCLVLGAPAGKIQISFSLIEYTMGKETVQLHSVIPSPRVPKQHSSLLLRPPLLILNVLLREVRRIYRGIKFLALLNLALFHCIYLIIPRSLV